MYKLQLSGQNLGQAINSGSGCVHFMQLCYYEVKEPNLAQTTLGFVILDIVLLAQTYWAHS
jgi:hypothetical protein